MTLKRKLKVPGLITAAALAVPVSMAYLAIHASQSLASNQQTNHIQAVVKPDIKPKIQLAILLDTFAFHVHEA